MKTFKKIGLVSAVAFALFAFNACGDDSNSTSASGENSTQSSAVENDESSSSINDNSSSSVTSDSDLESSSSSKTEGSCSSGKDPDVSNSSSSSEEKKESSSSVKKEESSSSVAKSSSSLGTSSSSTTRHLGGGCTQENAKAILDGEYCQCINGIWVLYIPPSSSSVASSSSHTYKWLTDPLNPDLSYGEFVDRRDGTKYATIEITNKYGPDSVQISFTVFAQNLKYREKMTLAADEQDDDTKVEGFCYHDSTEYCDDWYGAYYQWAEMMALPYECNSKSCADLIDPDGDGFHQGICPNDWHVMTQKEMLAVFYVTGIGDYEAMKADITFGGGGNGSNKSGFSLLAAGHREYSSNGSKFTDFHKESYYFFPPEYNETRSTGGGVGAEHGDIGRYVNPKKDGIPARCVKNYKLESLK
ncbi:MAG: hypothetical protein MJZ26_15035 [Fibrobacter sp.]|nr:hypothetical protein [Fibrobacter sp.]